MSGFAQDDSGATLVEFAVVLAMFVFILFGLIDFGRLGFSYVMAEKATQVAVRTAVVRPSACSALPEFNLRSSAGQAMTTLKSGVSCSAAPGLCVVATKVTCLGASSNPTAAAIWTAVRPLLPVNATIRNLRFSYAYDQNLGFLGGPYTPVVTVELANLTFEFISPLGRMAALAGDDKHPKLGAAFTFPSMSSSLPAEDLR